MSYPLWMLRLIWWCGLGDGKQGGEGALSWTLYVAGLVCPVICALSFHGFSARATAVREAAPATVMSRSMRAVSAACDPGAAEEAPWAKQGVFEHDGIVLADVQSTQGEWPAVWNVPPLPTGPLPQEEPAATAAGGQDRHKTR